MQNLIFVLDANKQVLTPCHPSVARKLLKDGKAAVYRRYPFTIILKRAIENPSTDPIALKVDPGSKNTGIALVQCGKVIFAAELTHRGQQIKDAMQDRSAVRKKRRQRKTRYRKPRFDNRTRKEGWLAPSLKSRVDNIQTWLVRFLKLCNVQSISMELVRFDTQLMQNAEISGVEYQQGELQGYEVREYLLEKFGRKCCYCGKTGMALEIEHIIPKSRGGSNRVSNLCLACRPCNQRKGNQTAAEFGYPHIQDQSKKPLKDAGAINSVRWTIWRMFDATGIALEVGTGGRTKFNRVCQNYPKAHWIDAACVGKSGQSITLNSNHRPLTIIATGRGMRQMQRMNKYGFPCALPRERVKRRHGLQTGDIVKLTVSQGKNAGKHVGRIIASGKSMTEMRPSNDGTKRIASRKRTLFKLIHRSDGYNYREK